MVAFERTKPVLVLLSILILSAILVPQQISQEPLTFSLYWDLGCTQQVIAVNWTTLYADAWYSKDFYFKNTWTSVTNTGEIYLYTIDSIVPRELGPYMKFRWSNGGRDQNNLWNMLNVRLKTNQVGLITLWMRIDRGFPMWIHNFSYNIHFWSVLLGDVNRDDEANLLDAARISSSFSILGQYPLVDSWYDNGTNQYFSDLYLYWNSSAYQADLDFDRKVNIMDAALLNWNFLARAI